MKKNLSVFMLVIMLSLTILACDGPPQPVCAEGLITVEEAVWIEEEGVWTDPICREPVQGCMDQEAWNFDPGAEVDDGSCVYDVCPNLEGLQETIPDGYVKPGRRCLPQPEPLHNYWLDAYADADCEEACLYIAVMDFDDVVLGPFATNCVAWTDPFAVEVAGPWTFIGYNAGEPYGTLFAEDVGEISEPEICLQDEPTPTPTTPPESPTPTPTPPPHETGGMDDNPAPFIAGIVALTAIVTAVVYESKRRANCIKR